VANTAMCDQKVASVEKPTELLFSAEFKLWKNCWGWTPHISPYRGLSVCLSFVVCHIRVPCL